MEPLGPRDVAAALEALGSDIAIRHFDDHTTTSADAARVLGIQVGQIAKSLCFLAKGAPLLVVTSGDTKVLEARIAGEIEVGRKKIRIATPQQCLVIFGYLPGGVPPFGLRNPAIPVYVDRSLARFDVVWAAAGSPHDNFPTSYHGLLDLTRGRAVEWAEVREAGV